MLSLGLSSFSSRASAPPHHWNLPRYSHITWGSLWTEHQAQPASTFNLNEKGHSLWDRWRPGWQLGIQYSGDSQWLRQGRCDCSDLRHERTRQVEGGEATEQWDSITALAATTTKEMVGQTESPADSQSQLKPAETTPVSHHLSHHKAPKLCFLPQHYDIKHSLKF